MIIPAAGLGTRLLPATKEQPKEMLPVFASGSGTNNRLMPLVQLVFEQLYEVGLRDFCFVIGKGKRIIKDYFTKDLSFVNLLRSKGRTGSILELKNFYRRIENSSISWINQPEPKGFGDAVLKARSYIGSEKFIVHAGDTLIIPNGDHIRRLLKASDQSNADAIFLVKEIEDPRQYGVILAEKTSRGLMRVNRAVEKPTKPLSKLAIMPVYLFHPVIFEALQKCRPGLGGEVQLTDAIDRLIGWKRQVYAIKLGPDETPLDIGDPERYWSALRESYEFAKRNAKRNCASKDTRVP